MCDSSNGCPASSLVSAALLNHPSNIAKCCLTRAIEKVSAHTSENVAPSVADLM